MKKYLAFAVLCVLLSSCAIRIPPTLSDSLVKENGRYVSYTTHGVTIRLGQTVTLGNPSDKWNNCFGNIHYIMYVMTFGLVIWDNPLNATEAGKSFVIKKIRYGNNEVCIVIESEGLPYSIAVDAAITTGELILQKPPS